MVDLGHILIDVRGEVALTVVVAWIEAGYAKTESFVIVPIVPIESHFYPLEGEALVDHEGYVSIKAIISPNSWERRFRYSKNTVDISSLYQRLRLG